MSEHAGVPFDDRVTHRFGPSCVSPNVSSISAFPTSFEGITRQNGIWAKLVGIAERKPFSGMKKGFRIAPKTLLAENTRFELVRLLHQHAFQACAIDH
mgnify:FL=1